MAEKTKEQISFNMQRDTEVNEELAKQGFKILRFWGKEVKADVISCADKIEKALKGG